MSDIYKGDITPPLEKDIVVGSELEFLHRKLSDLCESLNKDLKDKQKEKLEEIMTCWSDIATLIGEDGFTDGFKMGAKIMMEVCDN